MARLALFDLDNTLLDRQSAFVGWAESFAADRGLGSEGVEWLRKVDDDGFADRAVVFQTTRSRFGLADTVADLIEEYRVHYPTFVMPDPTVNAAVQGLREAGWVVGVVTNGPSSQHEKLARTGLVAVVDAVCVSDEVGWAKPDARIFEEAARRCGLPLRGGEGWMVGDAPGPDVGGGGSVGLNTIWIARGRAWTEPGYRPHVEVPAVLDAVEVLRDR